MSNKYKKPDEPITRQEACTILDHRRFDSAVRAGEMVPLGKLTPDGSVVPPEEGAQTAPLAFDQQSVRNCAKVVAADLAKAAREHREAAKDIAKRQPPLTRRQIATHLGKRQTGILIRSGAIEPQGALTDTQTAAHVYNPDDVARVIGELADAKLAESRLLMRASKTRIPA